MPPSNDKIGLLIPFYGEWPPYAHSFVHSVSKSKLIDVLFITDLPPLPHHGANIRYVEMSLDEVRSLAEHKLGMNVSLDTPYKLCDFKPAYGHLFEELIQGYSHWAFGDIDVIFGRDLHHFCQNWFEFDVITFSEDWVTGSFTILRNSPETNQLFMKSETYAEAFGTKEMVGFDECHKIFETLQDRGVDAILEHDHRQSFTWVLRMEELGNRVKVWRKPVIKEFLPWLDFVYYAQGSLIQKDGTELLYYHLIREKTSSGFSMPHWILYPEYFLIDRYGFWPDSHRFLEGHVPGIRSRVFIALRQYLTSARNRSRMKVRL